ncbi:MAG: hypothetical protein D3920_00800 [Candidatus Electrothrix sp. AW2]|nr:hypothetical protein [Candidatus Electrothrix gigas]
MKKYFFLFFLSCFFVTLLLDVDKTFYIFQYGCTINSSTFLFITLSFFVSIFIDVVVEALKPSRDRINLPPIKK